MFFPGNKMKTFGTNSSNERPNAFTLVELIMVIGVMILLMTLLAPAFNSLKSAGDVTNAADTIKGVIEQARNYAMAK